MASHRGSILINEAKQGLAVLCAPYAVRSRNSSVLPELRGIGIGIAAHSRRCQVVVGHPLDGANEPAKNKEGNGTHLSRKAISFLFDQLAQILTFASSFEARSVTTYPLLVSSSCTLPASPLRSPGPPRA